jgi:beta-glucosidase
MTNDLNEITLQNSSILGEENGRTYRDLNKNGRLDIYEDPRRPIEARVEDLLSQMTLEEKAGLMFMNGVVVNDDGSLAEKPDQQGWGDIALHDVNERLLNHFNIWLIPGASQLAFWQNNLQKLAEESRLGIPITIASDPRNHFSDNIFAIAASEFSQWCETLGFAAIGDPALVREFADVVRQEYLATGIRVALHPQIDLATEPRWARVYNTFGEDAHLSAELGKAYILGLQGEQLGPHSVACMTKHFPGGGPQKEGLDPHFPFQKGQVYPGNNFDYHLIPFEAAIEVGTASMMPYYGVPVGQTDEEVAMSFNKAIITGLLREKCGYDGVVCTDWGLITDVPMGPDVVWPARAWGVEHLSRAERVLKVLEAGVDQFGGENAPELVVELVRDGRISEARIDQSIRRLLRQKFQLGLFDNPFVDLAQVPEVVGCSDFQTACTVTQRRAMTLLKNEDSVLPLKGRPSIYVKNIDPAMAAEYGDVVALPEGVDFAILRIKTPYYPIPSDIFLVSTFHHGDLDFKGEKLEEILTLLRMVPTIVVIYLDRAAVIPEISREAKGLLADFGASDAAVLDVVFGRSRPQGKLPLELPSSMEAVRSQKEDVPYDSENPLYPYGFGLSYE